MRTLATGRCSLNLSDFIVPLTPSYIGEKVSGITGLQNHFRAALQCLCLKLGAGEGGRRGMLTVELWPERPQCRDLGIGSPIG